MAPGFSSKTAFLLCFIEDHSHFCGTWQVFLRGGEKLKTPRGGSFNSLSFVVTFAICEW
jgi:hypothetical protein